MFRLVMCETLDEIHEVQLENIISKLRSKNKEKLLIEITQ